MVYATLAYGHKGESIEQFVHNINYNLLTLAVAMIIRIKEEDFIGLTEST